MLNNNLTVIDGRAISGKLILRETARYDEAVLKELRDEFPDKVIVEVLEESDVEDGAKK